MVSELVKQRVVGVVVLILMMVVIIPWGLNHSEVTPAINQHATSAVKNVMALNRPSVEVGQASAREISQHTKASTMQVQRSGHQDSEALHQQTKVMALSLPQGENQAAWYVQVGSFTGEKNANKLMSELVKANQKAKIQRYTAHGISLFRVYEGPFLTKAEALSSARVNWKGQKFFAVKFKG